ncbi:MAG: serine hydrolase domain-containing protein [Steroidobacteraceae bacterium]
MRILSSCLTLALAMSAVAAVREAAPPAASPAAATQQAPAAQQLPAGASSGATAVSAAAANLNDLPALEAFFDGALNADMPEHHVTGAVISIVKDGQLLFAKGYGRSDLARNTPIDPATSLFRIGSTTKTFTWTAVMQLVEQGKLDLDKDVNAYIKGFRIPDTYPQPITLRHIMTHTAGFEEGFLGYLIQSDPKKQVPISQALREHMPARVRPAGEMSSYSNYGAALAGLIVEQVSGTPFNEYIEKNIFEPLDMQFATVQEPVPARLAPYVTTGYKFRNGGEVAQPYEIVGGFRPAGSGAVSALDMTHFMLAHLQDGRYAERRILNPQTAQLMHATAFAPEPRFPGMALGFYHQDINGLDAFGHGGDTNYYHTDMLLLPKQNFGLFLSCITEDRRIIEKVEDAFFDRYFPRGSPRAQRLAHAAALPLATRYAGHYQWTRRNHSDIDKIFNLFTSLSVAPLENGNLLLGGLDPDGLQFEPIAPDLYREVLHGEWKISFRSNAAGHVTYMFFNILPFMPAERQPWYEQSSVWFTLLGAAALVFLSALAATYYRWREIRVMPIAEKRALWFGAAVAGWALGTVAVIAGVFAATGLDALAQHIPAALSAALIMPLVFVALSVWLIVVTGRVWRSRFWSTGRRIGYTLVLLAALVLCVFFWQWNLLGWHYG